MWNIMQLFRGLNRLNASHPLIPPLPFLPPNALSCPSPWSTSSTSPIHFTQHIVTSQLQMHPTPLNAPPFPFLLSPSLPSDSPPPLHFPHLHLILYYPPSNILWTHWPISMHLTHIYLLHTSPTAFQFNFTNEYQPLTISYHASPSPLPWLTHLYPCPLPMSLCHMSTYLSTLTSLTYLPVSTIHLSTHIFPLFSSSNLLSFSPSFLLSIRPPITLAHLPFLSPTSFSVSLPYLPDRIEEMRKGDLKRWIGFWDGREKMERKKKTNWQDRKVTRTKVYINVSGRSKMRDRLKGKEKGEEFKR